MLISLLVLCLILWAISLLPIPAPFAPIVQIVAAVVVILVLLEYLPVGAHGAL